MGGKEAKNVSRGFLEASLSFGSFKEWNGRKNKINKNEWLNEWKNRRKKYTYTDGSLKKEITIDQGKRKRYREFT